MPIQNIPLKDFKVNIGHCQVIIYNLDNLIFFIRLTVERRP
jgi:hypothetical protein